MMDSLKQRTKTMTEPVKILVHNIIEGPFHSWDVKDDLDGDYEGDFYFCQALVEFDGQVSQEEIRFEMFPDFYEMKAHLDRNKEPYEMEGEAF